MMGPLHENNDQKVLLIYVKRYEILLYVKSNYFSIFVIFKVW